MTRHVKYHWLIFTSKEKKSCFFLVVFCGVLKFFSVKFTDINGHTGHNNETSVSKFLFLTLEIHFWAFALLRSEQIRLPKIFSEAIYFSRTLP